MLKIQEFLIANPTDWKEKLKAAPYALKIEEKGNLVLFKYNQILSDFNKEICREARGLILEKNTWRVVRMAFTKFWNLGESFAAKLDYKNSTAMRKEDGSLISLYYYGGKWNIATNGKIDARDAELNCANFKTFKDLFLHTLHFYPTFSWSSLNPCLTYTMELCSNFNKVVCSYPKPSLYLLCARDNDTLQEYDVKRWSQIIEIPTPEFFQADSQEGYEKIVKSFGDNVEGIVIKDKNNNRIKLKTKLYFELHKTINNGHMTTERALELIKENDHYEFLSYFPQMIDFFNNIETQYHAALGVVNILKDEVEKWQKENLFSTRKDFSDWVKANYSDYASAAYLAYENKLEKTIENMSTKKLISFLKIKEN